MHKRLAPVLLSLLTLFASPSGNAAGSTANHPADHKAKLKQGEYLARVGDCISCHTVDGGKDYAGGLPMHTPFGDLLSPNITPDKQTGIGNWSADDFYRALHHGVRKNGDDLYPAFPYTFFTRVTRADSDLLYQFLMSLPAVNNPVDVNQLHFPFNVRLSMIAWRELYFTPQTFQPDPKRSAQWNRGAYLVEGLAHCSACHSPRNILGAIKSDAQWTGAEIDGWFALSLGNDLASGLGDWSEADLVKFLKTGTGKDGTTVLGPMAQVVKNSTSYLTDTDLKAIAHYLKTLPPSAAPDAELSSSSPSHARHKQGAVLYLDNCAACHKARGVGVPQAFPPLNGNPVVNADDPSNIIDVVLRGIPAQNNYPAMPAFADTLSDKQVAELVNYIRTGWDNRATANATAEMVSDRRQADTADR